MDHLTRETQWIGCHIRAVDREARTAEFVASTETPDRHGTIIKQNWDLRNFKKNPVVLWAHNRSEDGLPIGRAPDTKVEGKRLVTKIHFATEKANPKAEQVWQLILDDIQRAVSVGFYPRDVRFEKHDDIDVLVLDDNELIEISVTPIGSNPEALKRLYDRALATKDSSPANERGDSNTEPSKEIRMDLEKEVAALKQQVAERDGKLSAVEGRAAALENQNATLVKERDALKERAEKAEADVAQAEQRAIESEVDALIGVKIDPSERDGFVKLAKTDRSLFDHFIAQRADKKTLEPGKIPAESRAAEPNKDTEATQTIAEMAEQEG